ncbi:MAG: M23 family metallopeptidase [Chitinophagales bacterium]
MNNTKSVLLSFCFSLIVISANAQQVLFELPLKGITGKDYWVSNYMDHEASSLVRDAFCGDLSYNGHTGTDFAIRNFAAMDSGVEVYAVTPGVVVDAHDGEFDRNTVWKKGAIPNRVVIKDADGLVTTYLHLRKGSVAVAVGDTVKGGQVLGLVGSSGVSSGPHLHLEVHDTTGKVIDPFKGNCNTGAGLWKEQLPYDTAFYIIDYGFVPFKLADYSSERPPYGWGDTLTIGPKDFVSFWTNVRGVKRGQVFKTEWYDTYGDHLFGFENKAERSNWFHLYWSYVDLGGRGMSGRCWVKVFINDKEVLTLPFYIIRKAESTPQKKGKKPAH